MSDIPVPDTTQMAYDGQQLLKEMMAGGVKQMFTPTIIQASYGGFITIIDGGVYASTTLQEAFDFAASLASQKLGAAAKVNMNDLPRFMQPGVWDRVKSKIGVAPVVLMAIGAAALGLQIAFRSEGSSDHAKSNTFDVNPTAAWAWSEATRQVPRESSQGDEAAGGGWSNSLPEVDVRKVQTESYGERAQSGISSHAPRRLRTHNRPRD
jgi:hypothetical protein